MYISSLFIYSGFLFTFHLILKYLSRFYALDEPNHRKRHTQAIPQIGGLAFVFVFIVVSYQVDLIPLWLLIGSFVSLLLGVLDDNVVIRWQVKVLVQLALIVFLCNLFWGRFTEISFYHYTIPVTQPVILCIFTIWFIGIYNAVNLIDGLDGLAGGFMVLFSLSAAFLGESSFTYVNLFLAILLLVFLVFNQRPAKVFMGDAGSLFLGFYIAVLPLLYHELTLPISLNMTPFVLLASFLIADTSRVFFTRLLSGKSPMTADTIHFHHLVLYRSGSYLTTLFIIFFVTLFSTVFAILSNSFIFMQMSLLVHMALLFIFILTPPAPTYVNLISHFIAPVYAWHKGTLKILRTVWPHTVMVGGLLFFLLFSILLKIDSRSMIIWQTLLSFILFSFFLYMNRKHSTVISALQIFVSIFILEFSWSAEPDIIIKLITIFLLVTLIIFTAQRISGTIINEYSALDLLMLFITIGALGLSAAGIILNPWIFLAVFVIWFSFGFILRRIFDFNRK